MPQASRMTLDECHHRALDPFDAGIYRALRLEGRWRRRRRRSRRAMRRSSVLPAGDLPRPHSAHRTERDLRRIRRRSAGRHGGICGELRDSSSATRARCGVCSCSLNGAAAASASASCGTSSSMPPSMCWCCRRPSPRAVTRPDGSISGSGSSPMASSATRCASMACSTTTSCWRSSFDRTRQPRGCSCEQSMNMLR